MGAYNYATTIGEKEAAAAMRDLPISTKRTIEVCNVIRGMNSKKALALLGRVADLRQAIPATRFNDSRGHRPGMAAGSFPTIVATQLSLLIKSAQANATAKGLTKDTTIIRHICAHRGGASWHYGRKRRRQMKRTHVEIVLAQQSVVAQTRSQKPKTSDQKMEKGKSQ